MAKSERTERSVPAHNTSEPERGGHPVGFSTEEAEFGGWLNDLFDIAGEELPPRYAQTLLGEPRHAPASDDFEDRVAESVFARLGLARPQRRPVVRRNVRRHPARTPAHRKVLRTGRQVTTVALALMALFSLNALGATAALASMVQFIVGHGGAQVVAKYPKLSNPTTALSAKVGDPAIQFLPQWVGQQASGYSYVGLDVYASLSWTKGALVVMHYRKVDDQGAHYLSLLEFKPNAQVALQVVKDGAAAQVSLNSSSGVFVSGKWVRQNHMMVWEPGLRSEVIRRSPADPNVVIWLAVDNTDATQVAANKALVLTLATQLKTLSFNSSSGVPIDLRYVSSDLSANMAQSFNEDVLALVPNHTSADQSILYIKINLDGPDQSGMPIIVGPGQQ